MPEIGINARTLTKPEPTGVSRYTHKLLEALADRDDGIEYCLFGVDSLPEPFDEYESVKNAAVPSPAHSGLRAHRWEQTTLPRAIHHHDLDAFHTPAGQPPMVARTPLITTIHDISPVTHPEWFSWKYSTVYRLLTPLAVRTSDRILTVSQFARDEILDHYPHAAGKTVAAYNGVTEPAAGNEPVAGLSKGTYLLSVGATNPRKNLDGLVRAYRRYRQRVDDPVELVLAGPDREVFAAADVPPVDGVRTLGFVDDDELGWLYRNAAALVYPSLYEGFGLPIVEAMHAGTPIVTSNRGAMAEVADDASYLVDPTDPMEIADGIERVVTDDTLRNRLRSEGHGRADEFTWERTARETVAVYREVI
jgi:glycosyltransferase involved in cell wall biosynthesis